MRPIIAMIIAISAISPQPTLAKGCIRGAVAGAAAGHFVGKGHAVAGATVGCVVAHHHYAKQARAQRAAAKQNH
jgi:uncharacterized membrane protein YdjX (TVP38/TMEM64 family)